LVAWRMSIAQLLPRNPPGIHAPRRRRFVKSSQDRQSVAAFPPCLTGPAAKKLSSSAKCDRTRNRIRNSAGRRSATARNVATACVPTFRMSFDACRNPGRCPRRSRRCQGHLLFILAQPTHQVAREARPGRRSRRLRRSPPTVMDAR
jgi:hypothetical protein